MQNSALVPRIKLTAILQYILCFELLFVLFLFAGVYKADPRLAWLPVDLTALFFVLSVISGLVIVYKKKFVFSCKGLNIFILYMAFASFVLLSYLWTPGVLYGAQKTLYIWSLVMWSVAAPALIIAKELVRLKRLGIIFVLFALLLVFEAISNYIQAGHYGFVTAFGSNYLALGRIVGLSFILIFVYLMFWARSNYEKLLCFAAIVLKFWILLIAGGRGPLLATIFSALVPLLFSIHISLKGQMVKVKKYTLIILVINVLLSLIFVNLAGSGYATQTINRLIVLTDIDRGASAESRIQHYANAIDYWMESPVVGHGIGSWPVLNSGIDARGYPHNIILEILVELGLLGLFLFLITIVYAISLLRPFNSIGHQPIKVLLIMITLFTLINSMISGDITDNRLLFTCFGLMPAGFLHGGQSK